MEKIEKIVYINLESRPDRFKDINDEFVKFDFPKDKILKFNAIPTPSFGILGCGKSHLAVLKMAKEQGWKNVLILEDDFEIVISKEEFYEELDYFFNVFVASGRKWDVFMLAYNTNDLRDLPVEEEHSHKRKLGVVRFAQTASAYIVNGEYFDTLIQNLEEGNHQLELTGQHWIYANDMYWKSLQEKDNWFYPKKRMSMQRRSYPENKNYFC